MATPDIGHGAEAVEHASSIHVVLKAEEVFNLFGFPITNSLLMTWITMAVLIVFAYLFRN